MQSNSMQQEQRSASSPPRSISPNSPGGGGGTYNNTPHSRMQELPLHAPQPRFTLTPKSVGMEMRQPQSRQQQEHNLHQSRTESATIQRTSYNIKPFTNEQLEQLQASYENMACPSKAVKTEPGSELKSSTSVVTAASVCKPTGAERRPSSPLSSATLTFAHGEAAFTPPLSSTTHSLYKSPNPQVSQNLSSPSTPTNERQCTHPTHELKEATSPLLQELPTMHFEQQLQKFRSGSNFFTGGAAEINGQLNEIFVNRLNDIDANGQGDSNVSYL